MNYTARSFSLGLSLVILSLWFTSVAAQRSAYEITLSPVKPIKNSGFIITHIDNLTEDDFIIGSAQIGVDNRRVPVSLSLPLADAVHGAVMQGLPREESSAKLKMRVTKFRVDERTTYATERAIVHVGIEIYHLDRDQNELVLFRDEWETQKGGPVDATTKLSRLLSAGLHELLSKFSQTSWRETIDSGVSSLKTNHRYSQGFGWKYFAYPESGWYPDADAFVNNEPDESVSIKIKGENYYARLQGKVKASTLPFLLISNGQIFVPAAIVSSRQHNKRQLVPALYVGPYLYFEILHPSTADGLAGAVAGGLIGGTAGGVAGSMRPMGYVIQAKTGARILLDKTNFERLALEYDLDPESYKLNTKFGAVASRELILAINTKIKNQ